MRIPTNEQETVIQFYRDEKLATITTTDATMITKLNKLVNNSDAWEVTDQELSEGNVICVTYQVDKSLLSYRKSKKVVTDAMRERFKNKTAS